MQEREGDCLESGGDVHGRAEDLLGLLGGAQRRVAQMRRAPGIDGGGYVDEYLPREGLAHLTERRPVGAVGHSQDGYLGRPGGFAVQGAADEIRPQAFVELGRDAGGLLRCARADRDLLMARPAQGEAGALFPRPAQDGNPHGPPPLVRPAKTTLTRRAQDQKYGSGRTRPRTPVGFGIRPYST